MILPGKLRYLVKSVTGDLGAIKLKSLLDHPTQIFTRSPVGLCPICGHKGGFWNYGTPLREGVLCPKCGSLERHTVICRRNVTAIFNSTEIWRVGGDSVAGRDIDCRMRDVELVIGEALFTKNFTPPT